jgi:anti-anti-sigma factor
MIQLISRHSELDVDNTPTVLLPIRLTLVESVALKESCMQLLEGNSPSKNLILDFRRNTFIGSSGIGTLVTLYKAAISHGMELILKNVLPQAMMVLELTQLDQIFTIELSEQYLGYLINSSGNQLPTTHSSVSMPLVPTRRDYWAKTIHQRHI